MATNQLDLVDRCVGCILGGMCSDAFGASVEGWGPAEILAKFPAGLRDLVPAPHMGIYHLGPRCGMYTDDTLMCLALGTSIVERGAVDPHYTALCYSDFFRLFPQRGLPQSAQLVLTSLADGEDFRKTGTKAFPKGSFANGSAMRIAPVGLAYRNATRDELYTACAEATVSSHPNPLAIDPAFVLARAIALLVHMPSADAVDIPKLLQQLMAECQEPSMKEKLQWVIDNYQNAEITDWSANATLAESFQIKAIDAVAVVLWMFARYYKTPEQCVINTVAVGGDTDTIAAMVAYLLGAIHGASWIPARWLDPMENGPHGKDYARQMATQLAALDCRTLVAPDRQIGALWTANAATVDDFENALVQTRDRWLSEHADVDRYDL
eukprot:TRINITY_DN9212_c0_g1_i1.p1 TRINITY_DN9212_c0_g1~~TRINITY_DN9212_c0_g1_i1.p1  ORF type:complete len:395 (-),score=61.64 TRINITY_DN9212_c0_g1_i1:1007-2149(-)